VCRLYRQILKGIIIVNRGDTLVSDTVSCVISNNYGGPSKREIASLQTSLHQGDI